MRMRVSIYTHRTHAIAPGQAYTYHTAKALITRKCLRGMATATLNITFSIENRYARTLPTHRPIQKIKDAQSKMWSFCNKTQCFFNKNDSSHAHTSKAFGSTKTSVSDIDEKSFRAHTSKATPVIPCTHVPIRHPLLQRYWLSSPLNCRSLIYIYIYIYEHIYGHIYGQFYSHIWPYMSI